MDCAALLLDHRASILDESYTVLERSHVHHYEAAGEKFTRARLEGLFDLVVTAIGNRDLAAVSAYAVNVAGDRFKAGFDISEVQAAFNALEHAMWRRIVASSPAPDLAEATGLMSTVLGFRGIPIQPIMPAVIRSGTTLTMREISTIRQERKRAIMQPKIMTKASSRLSRSE